MDEIHFFLKERGIEEKTLAEMDRDKVSNIVIIFPMLMSLWEYVYNGSIDLNEIVKTWHWHLVGNGHCLPHVVDDCQGA